MLLPPQPAAGDTLAPRYRRIMSFGDVLDESIRLWRQHWITYVLVSAIALLPPGLLLVWISSQQSLQLRRTLDVAALQSGRLTLDDLIPMLQLPSLGAYLLVSILAGFLWTAAVLTTTDRFLHGAEPAIGNVYLTALKRFGIALVSTLLYFLACIGLLVPTALLAVPTLGGLLGGPIALILLLVWWLAPGSRKTWFKWLIILVAPFGLLIYIVGRWTMYFAAIVLEHQGPIAALRRSWQLTESHWFRAVGILLVAGLIIGILTSVITNAIQFPFAFGAASRGEIGMAPAETALVYGVNVVCQVLFSAIYGAVYALLFNDLRNRREGTDIAERLRELESTQPLPTNA